MSRLSFGASAPLMGAGLMVAAAVAFAALNVVLQYGGTVAAIASTSLAFWQYAIALLFLVPWILVEGRQFLGTKQLPLHLLRVVLAALGVQVWAYALSLVAIWQAIALLMTSPFFVIAGASLFLKEPLSPLRLGATLVGFFGALIILAPWSSSFSWPALLPVATAALWGGTTLLTKCLTRSESSVSITMYLLLFLTPINGAILLGAGFSLPTASDWPLLVCAGGLTALGNYCITRAYAVADATYLQPFDDLRLPLNILFGWLFFSTAPNAAFWPGALLILGASLFLLQRERGQEERRIASQSSR